MNLTLNSATKKVFLDIVSTMDLTRVMGVFQQFILVAEAVSIAKFAEIMAVSEEEALRLAQNKGELNTQGELVALLGFSVVPTNHTLLIENNKFYTWCAADTLIFPAILGINVIIYSTDPINSERIRIEVKKEFLTDISPPTAMISWVDEVDQDDIRCSMCNRVHFFVSEETAAKWQAHNQDVRVFTVADYFASGI